MTVYTEANSDRFVSMQFLLRPNNFACEPDVTMFPLSFPIDLYSGQSTISQDLQLTSVSKDVYKGFACPTVAD